MAASDQQGDDGKDRELHGKVLQLVSTASASGADATPAEQGFNYIRNAVKATVDAYDGDVNYYLADPDDPIIQANEAIFPGVFRPGSELPVEIVEHFRYPEDLFRIQTDQYQLYHMTNPDQLLFISRNRVLDSR